MRRASELTRLSERTSRPCCAGTARLRAGTPQKVNRQDPRMGVLPPASECLHTAGGLSLSRVQPSAHLTYCAAPSSAVTAAAASGIRFVAWKDEASISPSLLASVMPSWSSALSARPRPACPQGANQKPSTTWAALVHSHRSVYHMVLQAGPHRRTVGAWSTRTRDLLLPAFPGWLAHTYPSIPGFSGMLEYRQSGMLVYRLLWRSLSIIMAANCQDETDVSEGPLTISSQQTSALLRLLCSTKKVNALQQGLVVSSAASGEILLSLRAPTACGASQPHASPATLVRPEPGRAPSCSFCCHTTGQSLRADRPRTWLFKTICSPTRRKGSRPASTAAIQSARHAYTASGASWCGQWPAGLTLCRVACSPVSAGPDQAGI